MGVKLFVIVNFIVLVLMLLAFTSSAENKGSVYSLVVPSADNYTRIIAEALPLANNNLEEQLLPDYWVQRFIYIIAGFDSSNPEGIIGTELNIAYDQAVTGSLFSSARIIEEEGGEEDYYLPGQDEDINNWIVIPEEQISPVQLKGEPRVLIYTTHNAEAYKPTDGVSKLEGKNAGVATVSKVLSQTLESKYAIKTFYCDVIHDYPDFAKSYINSMSTVSQLLKRYQEVELVLDIHRDAGLKSRSDTLVKIGNKSYAKVMIVVGTEHEHWEENLAFAEELEDRANQQYPGLIKAIRVRKDRRYNQHLHPRALLLEFGSDLNTQEDATNSAVVLAEIIDDLMEKD
jgi:stage II sporulation protein P